MLDKKIDILCSESLNNKEIIEGVPELKNVLFVSFDSFSLKLANLFPQFALHFQSCEDDLRGST